MRLTSESDNYQIVKGFIVPEWAAIALSRRVGKPATMHVPIWPAEMGASRMQ